MNFQAVRSRTMSGVSGSMNIRPGSDSGPIARRPSAKSTDPPSVVNLTGYARERSEAKAMIEREFHA